MEVLQGRLCNACGIRKPAEMFSNGQLKKKADERQCKECVEKSKGIPKSKTVTTPGFGKFAFETPNKVTLPLPEESPREEQAETSPSPSLIANFDDLDLNPTPEKEDPQTPIKQMPTTNYDYDDYLDVTPISMKSNVSLDRIAGRKQVDEETRKALNREYRENDRRQTLEEGHQDREQEDFALYGGKKRINFVSDFECDFQELDANYVQFEDISTVDLGDVRDGLGRKIDRFGNVIKEEKQDEDQSDSHIECTRCDIINRSEENIIVQLESLSPPRPTYPPPSRPQQRIAPSPSPTPKKRAAPPPPRASPTKAYSKRPPPKPPTKRPAPPPPVPSTQPVSAKRPPPPPPVQQPSSVSSTEPVQPVAKSISAAAASTPVQPAEPIQPKSISPPIAQEVTDEDLLAKIEAQQREFEEQQREFEEKQRKLLEEKQKEFEEKQKELEALKQMVLQRSSQPPSVEATSVETVCTTPVKPPPPAASVEATSVQPISTTSTGPPNPPASVASSSSAAKPKRSPPPPPPRRKLNPAAIAKQVAMKVAAGDVQERNIIIFEIFFFKFLASEFLILVA